MKLLSFSGASTKISALAAHAKNNKDFKPDIIAGLSSGALIILPYLLGKHEELKELSTNLKLSDIFDKSPVNKNGKIPFLGYIRGLLKGSFGSMRGLEKTIKKYISIKEYYTLIQSPDCPIIYIGVVNVNTKTFELIELNKCSYEYAIKVLIASSSIPMYTPPIELETGFYLDGGLFNHNPASEIIRMYNTKLTEVLSVYSIPNEIDKPDYAYNGKSIGRTLSKTFEVLQNAISVENQKTEVDLCLYYNVKLTQLFSPKVLKGVYDVNNQRLKELYDKTLNY